MSIAYIFFAALLSSSPAIPQKAKASSNSLLLSPRTTLPIVFTKNISADRAQVGDPVYARTTQIVRFANGSVIPAGTKVIGHVETASGFIYNKAPYAHQKESVLTIHFDSLQLGQQSVPLSVTVRAMADPLTSWSARTPKSTDLDPVGTLTQIGGDQLTPSQGKVTNMDGDVVAYNRHGGVYARLIASEGCDGSDVEVSVGIYSASACGLYGFTGVSDRERGSVAVQSTLSLVSAHVSPRVWRNSTALLEVLPEAKTIATR